MANTPSASNPTKVVLIGATGVGKTSIILRHNGQGFTTNVSPTIGASFCRSTMCVENQTVEMQIWDTAGQERFRSMAPMYYRNADAAFAVYDITSEESFIEMQSWISELRQRMVEPVILCVLGNKSDRNSDREVSEDTGREYAEGIGADFFETSAFSGSGIERAFRVLSLKILDRKGIGAAGSGEVKLDQRDKKHKKCCSS